MTINLALPAIVAIVGLLLYGLTSGKVSEVGRVAFFAGLLALLMRG